MADVRCPMCGKPNPEELDVCQFCQARLKPVTAPLPEGEATIHPGEVPTKKSTAELEPPDWLAGLEAETKEEEEEVPDWLTGIQASTPKPTTETKEQPVEENKEANWLTSLRGESMTADAEEQGRETTGNFTTEAPSESAKTGDELPSWIINLETEVKKETAASNEGNLTSWSSEDTGKEAATESIIPSNIPMTPVGGEEPVSTGKILDWLASLEAEKPASEIPAIPPSDKIPTLEGELRGWLSGQEEAAQTEPFGEASIPVENVAKSISEPDLSEWLSKMPEETPNIPPEERFQESSTGPQEELSEWLASPPDLDEQPVNQAQAQPSTPEEPSPTQGQGAPRSAPAFITDEGTPSKSNLEEIFSMEMPDWLSTLGPDEKRHPKAHEAGRGDESAASLTPAELPTWVQAMRPVEAVVPEAPAGEVTEQILEKDGPLAGLHGILPALPGIGPVSKPHAYDVKLQVTDNQAAHATLLEQVLANEAQPRPISSSSHAPSQRILRWVIAGLLTFFIGIAVFTGTQFTPLNALLPRETMDAAQVINSLPLNPPVLLVFDYEPALAGEMETIAAPLVYHLMIKGARLTILSTSPTGSVLAERFLSLVKVDPPYQREQQYVNLGYMPGGAAGVLGFAASPTTTVLQTVDGTFAWQTPALLGVKKLSDFTALFILTDSAEVGRIWIEQALAYAGTAPLVMVSSAQAEPMLRPYIETGQIKGLVGGLVGGAAYEQIIGRPGLGRRYWDAYTIGLLAAEAMIVIGGLWSLITTWKERRMKRAD